MGTWVYDLECRVRNLRVVEGKLDNWRERPLDDGTLSVDPVYGDGSRLFAEDQPWSFGSDVAALVAECEPGSAVNLFAEDGLSFVRIARARDGEVRISVREAAHPFEAQPA